MLAETKKVLQISQHESIVTRLPLCVEISLQTVEGDNMILEVWSLAVQKDQCDLQVRATHAIYNRMGLLLKSLLSVTRSTPAYKLSRRQSADSYQIFYRIYIGEPQTHQLGKYSLYAAIDFSNSASMHPHVPERSRKTHTVRCVTFGRSQVHKHSISQTCVSI